MNESDQRLGILLEEPHFLAINKPAGLFTQAAAGIDSVQTELQKLLKERDRHPGLPFVGLPHRLDRGTSGAMLIAKNQRALKRLSEQFHSRKIGKYYLCVVEGRLPAQTQHWVDFVRKIPDLAKAELCKSDDAGGRAAEMQIRSLAFDQGQSLALVRLLTGRMHQIRVQAAARGHCIIGDMTYGCQQRGIGVRSDGESEVALHSLRIEFRHPQTARSLAATAPLPPAWQALPEALHHAATALAKASLLAASGSQVETNWLSS